MSESFFSYFDGIESTFDMMKKADLNIKSRFLLKMRGYYLDYLVSRGFDIGDKEKIKANSQDCLIWIEKKIRNDLGPNPKIDCFQEELSDYVFALIVYAFYRCRILIPVESEDDN